MVGDTWIALGDYPLPVRNRGLEAQLVEGGLAYSYMSYVDPTVRGQGLFPLLIRGSYEAVRKQGRNGLFGSVLQRSASSLATIKRLGFTSRGKLHVYRLLGRQVSRFSTTRTFS